MRKFLFFGLLAAALVFTGCDKNEGYGSTKVPVGSVTTSSYFEELLISGTPYTATITLSVTVMPENASNKNVKWTSSDEKVATVSPDGVVTAVGKGNAKIIATAVDGSLEHDFCRIKVIETMGTAKRTGDVDVTWVQLWRDGPKFAEYNVGANSVGEFGGYYCWGGSIDKDPNGQCKVGGKDSLTGEEDTAFKLWGSNWRMPTSSELTDLLESYYCKSEWTEDYKGTGKKGRIFTGLNKYSANSVFFPETGSYTIYGGIKDNGGNSYWSSTPNGTDNAKILYISSDWQKMEMVFATARGNGLPVRAVLTE